MDKRAGSNIFLIGFSTSGKSKVGQEVARRLGWGFMDTDDEIVGLAGKEISEIFAQEGEQHFRELERQVLLRACLRQRTVVATGGGAIVDPRNRDLMTQSGMIVCLEAKPETIYQRLLQDKEGPVRPLLSTPDPARRIAELKEARQPYYALADWTVHTDNLSMEEVCQEVVRGWHYWSRANPADIGWQDDLACEVTTATEHYPVYVGWGTLTSLGRRMTQAGLSGTANVIGDETVSFIYGDRVKGCLQGAGFGVNSLAVPPGETTKTIDTAIRIYDWLVENRAEREDVIVALGGGMTGDLAGFVAATFLRGLSVVQVPTSLVAMVDAAIGGKTAVNHPQAKNIIGCFHQPRLVLADVQTLTTLPRRELVSGWAEVIKHGLILDAEFFESLEENAAELLRLEPEIAARAIGRSAAIKARIVSEDEKERGRRTLLNYGHTIAHGLEAAADYQGLLHGEAVAIGMMGAAMLSGRMGLLAKEGVERQRALLERFGLPAAGGDVDRAAVLKAMELDKKTRGKAIRWVLLEDIGKAVIREDVPATLVAEVLGELMAGQR